jgi:hypothetical protein
VTAELNKSQMKNKFYFVYNVQRLVTVSIIGISVTYVMDSYFES